MLRLEVVPWLEVPDMWARRARQAVREIHRDYDVAGLCRELPERLTAVRIGDGGRASGVNLTLSPETLESAVFSLPFRIIKLTAESFSCMMVDERVEEAVPKMTTTRAGRGGA